MTGQMDVDAPPGIIDIDNDMTVPLACAHIIPHCLGEEGKTAVDVQAI